MHVNIFICLYIICIHTHTCMDSGLYECETLPMNCTNRQMNRLNIFDPAKRIKRFQISKPVRSKASASRQHPCSLCWHLIPGPAVLHPLITSIWLSGTIFVASRRMTQTPTVWTCLSITEIFWTVIFILMEHKCLLWKTCYFFFLNCCLFVCLFSVKYSFCLHTECEVVQ